MRKRLRFDLSKLTPAQIEALNDDWIRVVGWDFYVPDERGERKLVTTLEDMLRLLGFNPRFLQPSDIPALRTAVKGFESLPAALGMPEPLRTQWEHLLRILGVEPSPYRKALKS